MITQKYKQTDNSKLTNGFTSQTNKMTNEAISVGYRYATANAGITVIVLLIISRLADITLTNGFMVASVGGLVVFGYFFNKGIDLARVEFETIQNAYESDKQALSQSFKLPMPEVHISHEEPTESGGQRWTWDTLGVDLPTLTNLSQALLSGKLFNRKTCQDNGISQTRFDDFKAKMLEFGYIVQNGKSYQPTTKGMATFKYLANNPPPTPLLAQIEQD